MRSVILVRGRESLGNFMHRVFDWPGGFGPWKFSSFFYFLQGSECLMLTNRTLIRHVEKILTFMGNGVSIEQKLDLHVREHNPISHFLFLAISLCAFSLRVEIEKRFPRTTKPREATRIGWRVSTYAAPNGDTQIVKQWFLVCRKIWTLKWALKFWRSTLTYRYFTKNIYGLWETLEKSIGPQPIDIFSFLLSPSPQRRACHSIVFTFSLVFKH